MKLGVLAVPDSRNCVITAATVCCTAYDQGTNSSDGWKWLFNHESALSRTAVPWYIMLVLFWDCDLAVQPGAPSPERTSGHIWNLDTVEHSTPVIAWKGNMRSAEKGDLARSGTQAEYDPRLV